MNNTNQNFCWFRLANLYQIVEMLPSDYMSDMSQNFVCFSYPICPF